MAWVWVQRRLAVQCTSWWLPSIRLPRIWPSIPSLPPLQPLCHPSFPLQTAAEPTFCMGDDVPLPVLAGTPHMLYDYFKQRFAQVRCSTILYHFIQCLAASAPGMLYDYFKQCFAQVSTSELSSGWSR